MKFVTARIYQSLRFFNALQILQVLQSCKGTPYGWGDLTDKEDFNDFSFTDFQNRLIISKIGLLNIC